MMTYVLKRLLAMVPTLLGITFVTFLIISLAPGDPVSTRFGSAGGPSAEGGDNSQDRQADTIKAKRKLLGMLTEDHSVLGWSTAQAPLPPPRTGDGSGAAEAPSQELVRAGRWPTGDAWCHALAMSADGATLVAAGDEKSLRVIDVQSRKTRLILAGHAVEVWALALSADGTRLASADTNGEIRTWDLRAEGKALATVTPTREIVHDLAFLPDSRLASAGGDGVIRILDSATGDVLSSLGEHVGSAYALAVSGDGSRLWSAGVDRRVLEWSLADLSAPPREVVKLRQPVRDLALSPDGRVLAAACEDRNAYLLDLAASGDAAILNELEGHYRGVTAVAFSRDGRTAYSGSRDETIRSWDVASGRPVAMNAQSAGLVHRLLVMPDGATLLSASDSWTPVPIWRRYLKWLHRIVTLDFDRSFIDDEKVIAKIARALPVTLGLNVIAIALIYAIAIPVGIKAAVQRGSTYDHVSSVVLFVLYSVPSFWAGTMLVLLFSSKLNWDLLPSVGLSSLDSQNLSYLSWLWDRLAHLVLPITVMVYGGLAGLSRYARTSMLETISADFIRTARAKGLSERVVIYKHALRNSLITIVTLVATLLPSMIGGSVIVEYIFTINGMGRLGFDAILSRDYPVIMAITTFSGFLTLFGMLVSDILYSVVDPRISHS